MGTLGRRLFFWKVGAFTIFNMVSSKTLCFHVCKQYVRSIRQNTVFLGALAVCKQYVSSM